MKSIEINYKTSDSYEVLYPTTVADNVSIIFSEFAGNLTEYAEYLQGLFTAVKADKAEVVYGHYVGNGNTGSNRTLVLGINPVMVAIIEGIGKDGQTFLFLKPSYEIVQGGSNIPELAGWNDNGVIIERASSNWSELALNTNGVTYYYVAVGFGL